MKNTWQQHGLSVLVVVMYPSVMHAYLSDIQRGCVAKSVTREKNKYLITRVLLINFNKKKKKIRKLLHKKL